MRTLKLINLPTLDFYTFLPTYTHNTIVSVLKATCKAKRAVERKVPKKKIAASCAASKNTFKANLEKGKIRKRIQLGAKSSVREARVNARTPKHQFVNPPTKCHHDVAHFNKLVEMQEMGVI